MLDVPVSGVLRAASGGTSPAIPDGHGSHPRQSPRSQRSPLRTRDLDGTRLRFARDSLLEGSGFKLSVPLRLATTSELSVPLAINAVYAVGHLAAEASNHQAYPLSG
jgi:hypothetical protein